MEIYYDRTLEKIFIRFWTSDYNYYHFIELSLKDSEKELDLSKTNIHDKYDKITINQRNVCIKTYKCKKSNISWTEFIKAMDFQDATDLDFVINPLQLNIEEIILCALKKYTEEKIKQLSKDILNSNDNLFISKTNENYKFRIQYLEFLSLILEFDLKTGMITLTEMDNLFPEENLKKRHFLKDVERKCNKEGVLSHKQLKNLRFSVTFIFIIRLF